MTAATAQVHAGGLWRRLAAPWRAFDSPVLTRELRVRIRGRRAFVVMGIYVVVLSAFAVGYLFVHGIVGGAFSAGRPPTASDIYAQLGRDLFVILAYTQLALVILFAPALTCGVITTEWERGTLELLALTLVPSRSVVAGKFAASLGYVALLMLSSVPIFTLPLMLGGVSPLEIATVYLVTAAAALFFGAQGVLASTVARRTYVATVLAYGLMVFWMTGFFMSALGGLALFIFGGLILAGLTTATFYWLVARRRRRVIVDRSPYIAIFGLTFCAVVGLLNLPPFFSYAEDFFFSTLHGMGPFEIVELLVRGPWAQPTGYIPAAAPSAWVVLAAVLAPLLRLGALCVFGGGVALLAATSLFDSMRAPQPDALEVRARVAGNRRRTAVLRKDGS